MDTLFIKILDMSKMASVVILLVMLVRLCLKKAPKIYSYVLWAVVLFRLLCPITLEVPLSLVPQMDSIADTYTLAEKEISFADAGEAAYQAVGDALNGGLGIQHIRTTEKDEEGNTVYVTSYWWEVWILFGKYVWVAGIICMAGYSVSSYYKLKKKLVGTMLLQNNMYISDYIDSPFVMGLAKPNIYLPSSLSEKEQEYIILHEQKHIKRGDHWIKAIAFFALCIHWFNPLVWLAFILANKDMEMSCDEAVVRQMGQEVRADYSASLLSLATGHRMIMGTPLAFGEGDTKGRIKNMAKWKKPTLWICVVALVIVLVTSIALVTNQRNQNTDENYLQEFSGDVVAYGGNPTCFELRCEDGTNYGFVTTDNCELLWEDTSLLETEQSRTNRWDLFSVGMQVNVVARKKAEGYDDYFNYECVDAWYYAETVTVTEVFGEYFPVDEKPVIYLYPQETIEAEVFLEYDGKLTCTYPLYEDGWKVTAFPDGTLMDEDGKYYNYLYWEGVADVAYDFSKGFCVAGEDTAEFLENALAQLGLNRKEANEFIVYWLPLMQENPYNIISFQNEAYTENAKLHINPCPDTMIRVFMAWKPATEKIEIEPQELSAPDRTGFTVVEWGGSQVKD